jgi:peptidyl-prolyl cis-trans isomerase SurA
LRRKPIFSIFPERFMSYSRPFLALGLLLLTSLSSTAVQAQTTAIDSIVAVIDEDVILRSELEQAVGNIKTQYAKQAGQLPPENILERQVLERLILQRLQINRAKEISIRVSDAELTQVIENIAKSNNMTQAQFQQRLQQDGLAFEDYRNNLRDELMQQRLRQSYVQSRVQISEAEVDQFVAAQQSTGPEVLLANILVALPESPTAEQVETAKRKIDGILDLVRKGQMTFQAAAIRYSDAQNALDGGQIGWRTMDSIPPQFTTMLAQMKAGDITEPVRGPNGYQLIQVAEVRDSQAAQLVEEFRAQAILIDPTAVGGNEVARQRADELRERISKGEDFGKLAKEFSSEDMNASSGGMLDWFSQNQWGSSIGGQIVRLKDGEISPVLQTDAGYLFIKRLGTRSQDANAENKRRKARETIGQRKAEEEYERFLRQLRAEAFVESRLATS